MTDESAPQGPPPGEPPATPPAAPPEKRAWVPGCLGALVGFIGALPVLLFFGFVATSVRGIGLPTKTLLPILGFAAAVAAVVALSKLRRRGFTKGLLIGAATVSLLFGICSGL